MNEYTHNINTNQQNIMTKLFIYTLFIALAIYNQTNTMLRPTELLTPFLFLVVLSQYRQIKHIILLGIFLLSYLILVDFSNNGFTPSTFSRSRIWLYAILFIASAKIFVSIDQIKYKQTIFNAFLLSIGIILLAYLLIYLRIPFALHYLSPMAIMKNTQFFESGRILGVSTTLFLFFLIYAYLNNMSRFFIHFLFLSQIFLFFIQQSRTALFTFLIVYILLFFSKKAIIVLSVLFASSLSLIKIFLSNLMASEQFGRVGARLAEMLYFYKSPSMFVRLNDTSYFLKDWLTSWTSFLIGHGFSHKIHFPRYGFQYNPFTGNLEIIYGYIDMQYRHNADNLLSLLINEGGLFLLLFILILFIWSFIKIFKIDKRLGIVFLTLIIMESLSTVHLITSYVLVFLLAYIYYGTLNIENKVLSS